MEVLAVSPSSPEEHQQIIDLHGLQFDIVTDVNYQFGINLGFVDIEEQAIFRGYIGVNPENNSLIKEVDYLLGDNIETVLEKMKGL